MRKEGRRRMQTRFSCLLFSLSLHFSLRRHKAPVLFSWVGRTGWRLILCHSVHLPIGGIKTRLVDLILLPLQRGHQRLTGPLSKALGRTRSGGANLGDCLDFSGSCHLNNSSILESSQSNRGQPTRPFLLSWDEWEVGELILKMIDCCCLVSLFR